MPGKGGKEEKKFPLGDSPLDLLCGLALGGGKRETRKKEPGPYLCPFLRLLHQGRQEGEKRGSLLERGGERHNLSILPPFRAPSQPQGREKRGTT